MEVLHYGHHKDHSYILSSKSGQLGAGIVQIQGENDPDKLEKAYSTGVELTKTFYENGEIPVRDMSEIPHPFIQESMGHLQEIPDSEKE